MYVDYTPEQRELSAELRAYFTELMTPERLAGCRGMEGGATYRETIAQIGKDGWLGVGWPKEYGGGGMTPIEQLIFFEEVRRAHAPLPFVTLNTVGPALMALGSEEHKREFLPRILSGDAHFAIGYTEPEAGTDLASLKTSAVKDGDDYVINGTKIFTSGANDADYVWLATRTDPEAKKHRGITIFIVDTTLPGFTHSMIHTIGGGATCMTYYEDVRVPSSMIVGGLNGGWQLITHQLNHERIGLAAFGSIAFKYADEVRDYVRETLDEDGRPLIENARIQLALAEVRARLEAAKLMNWRMASALERDELDPAMASAAKVYSTEAMIDVYGLLLECLGPAGALRRGSAGAILQGQIGQEARGATINTFGGGVNEVQREIIAMAGLRLPRAPR